MRYAIKSSEGVRVDLITAERVAHAAELFSKKHYGSTAVAARVTGEKGLCGMFQAFTANAPAGEGKAFWVVEES